VNASGVASRPGMPRTAVGTLWLVAFAAILFGTKLWFIGSYGNATPLWDQWGGEAALLFKPHVEGRLEWPALVAPHVGHRILTSRLIALGLFSANGRWNPLLEMVVNAALWTGILVMLISFLDRATGRRHLLLLLAFALVAFGLPHGHENMLWGFQGLFYVFVFWSTLSLWAFAVAPPLAAGWWAGICCGVLAMLTLGSAAITAAAAAAVATAHYVTHTRRGALQIVSIGALVALFVAGVLVTPSPKSTMALRAASVGQALTAWSMTASWPLKLGPVGPLVIYGPALVLTASLLRRPPPAGDPRWFLLAAAAAALGQAAALAYGRATNCLASRYQDLFSVGLIVNFACALAALPGWPARHRGWSVAAVVAWTGIVVGALAMHAHHDVRGALEFRRDTGAAQEAHTRAYVVSGNIDHLTNKPFLHVPYPNAQRLANLLDDPVIRGFLPAVVAPPLTATTFASQPVGAFVEGGADPGLPSADGTSWGSLGPNGPGVTGTATIDFAGPDPGYAVEVPVAVGGTGGGITIDVEQDGVARPVPLPGARDSWTPVRVKVKGRPFLLRVTDRSATGWVAVAAPTPQGRFDHRVDRLLAHWDRFVLAGIVLGLTLLVHARLVATEC
jgi:hypothetical protein